MKIIPLTDEYRSQIDQFVANEWGGPMVVTLGVLYDTGVLPGFVAVDDGKLAGAILYRIEEDVCEIAILFSLVSNRGVGSALIDRAIALSKERGCRRVWLVTTNDNTHAIRFYQKYGFSLKAVHIGSMEATRRLKGELPTCGIDGIPLEHEFEFEILFDETI